MMQTTALLIDSFRMMVARKLFWITLGINVLVVFVYGSIGTNEKGLTMLFGLFDVGFAMFANDSPVYDSLMQGIFSGMLVPLWLAWIATILALVSTTSVFPDFQQEGAIDIVLSKPISRWKIFFVKYLGSLLFVFMQVAIFCVGVFLVVGLRLGDWNWTILAGVPIVLIFYSYLYSFNTLIGVVTRSAIAALLFTMLFWFVLFLIQSTEGTLNVLRTQQEMEVQRHERRLEATERALERTEQPQSMGEAVTTMFNHPDTLRTRIVSINEQLDEDRATLRTMTRWHDLMRTSLAVLPKNQETIGQLDRWIRADTAYTLAEIFGGQVPQDERVSAQPPAADSDEQAEALGIALDELESGESELSREERFERQQERQREAAERVQEELDQRSPWFIIGTSLGFEAVLLLIAGWVFARRDY